MFFSLTFLYLFAATYDAVDITSSNKNETVVSGSDVIITCIGNTPNTEKMKLMKDGKAVNETLKSYQERHTSSPFVPFPFVIFKQGSPKNPTLHNFKLMNVTANDSGEYTCVATLKNGTQETSTTLKLMVEQNATLIESFISFNFTEELPHFRIDGNQISYDAFIDERDHKVVCRYLSSELMFLNSDIMVTVNGTQISENYTNRYQMVHHNANYSYASVFVDSVHGGGKSSKNGSIFRCVLTNNSIVHSINGTITHAMKEMISKIYDRAEEIYVEVSVALGKNKTTKGKKKGNYTSQQFGHIAVTTPQPVENITENSNESTTVEFESEVIKGVSKPAHNSSYVTEFRKETTSSKPQSEKEEEEAESDKTRLRSNVHHGSKPDIKVYLRRVQQDVVVTCTTANLTGNATLMLEKSGVPIPFTGSHASKNNLEIKILNVHDSELDNYACAIYDDKIRIGEPFRFAQHYFTSSEEETIFASKQKDFKYSDMYPMIYFENYKTVEYLPSGSRYIKKCIAKGLGHDRLKMYFGRKDISSDPRVHIQSKPGMTISTLKINSITHKDFGRYECRVNYGTINMKLSFLLKSDRIF